MKDSATCRSCGAPIRFVRTTKGKLMPLDREPHPDGNIELDTEGHATVHGQPPLDAGPLYLSHFVSCPSASENRRPR